VAALNAIKLRNPPVRLKQVCNLEGFQVRTERAIRNHLFSALCGYIQLALAKARGEIANCYEISRKLFLEVIAKFIRENSEKFEFVNSHSQIFVNAQLLVNWNIQIF